MSERLKWCRQRYGWTQQDLAAASGLGLATIRRVEQEQFAPRLATVQRLAETLQVREGWLAFGELPMVSPAQMTAEEQAKTRTGPDTDGPTGTIGTRGPWYTDGDGWKIDERFVRQKRTTR
jgi:transcriptional regulator with XRE-family HTH domain